MIAYNKRPSRKCKNKKGGERGQYYLFLIFRDKQLKRRG